MLSIYFKTFVIIFVFFQNGKRRFTLLIYNLEFSLYLCLPLCLSLFILLHLDQNVLLDLRFYSHLNLKFQYSSYLRIAVYISGEVELRVKVNARSRGVAYILLMFTWNSMSITVVHFCNEQLK